MCIDAVNKFNDKVTTFLSIYALIIFLGFFCVKLQLRFFGIFF